uniref:polyketide synthase dehydratase domain-containing protein n=1 Tax=Streptomyces sp. NRRL F-5650 TaxID=1463868 RepID=UPI000561548A
HYWLDGAAGAAEVSGAGLSALGHPLLAAGIALASGEGHLFTGRISLQTHSWLAGHAVLGRVLVPGAALLELVLRAGESVGCELLEELVLQAPLVVPGGDAVVDLQVAVGSPDEQGRRTVQLHSREVRPGQEDDGAEWVCEELFADVVLPEGAERDAGRFGVHPALVDAALQTGLVTLLEDDGERMMPFSFAGARLHATGATAARVRLTPTGADSLEVRLTDGTGLPVLTIEALTSRPLTLDTLSRQSVDSLYEVNWASLAGDSDERRPPNIRAVSCWSTWTTRRRPSWPCPPRSPER